MSESCGMLCVIPWCPACERDATLWGIADHARNLWVCGWCKAEYGYLSPIGPQIYPGCFNGLQCLGYEMAQRREAAFWKALFQGDQPHA